MDVGAGPFLLIYSRSLPGPLKSEWPGAPVSPEGRTPGGAMADSPEFSLPCSRETTDDPNPTLFELARCPQPE